MFNQYSCGRTMMQKCPTSSCYWFDNKSDQTQYTLYSMQYHRLPQNHLKRISVQGKSLWQTLFTHHTLQVFNGWRTPLATVMNVKASLAKKFPLIEPILLYLLFAKCPLPYTSKYTDPQYISQYSSILIQHYVSCLRILLVKPTPPPDSTHFGTAAHMYVVMSFHHIMVTLSPITEYSGDCVKSDIDNAC